MESIDYRSFKESALQATVYTPDLDHTVTKVMSGFYPKHSAMFDSGPEVLPNMPGLPPEVPRIIMRNQNNSSRLEIAASRLNFFAGLTSIDGEQLDTSKFYDNAVQLFSNFQEITECRIARLAAVRTLYVVHENPGLYLARHFCKSIWDQAPLNRPENFEMHSHKVYQLADKFDINSWARNKTGFLVSDKKEKVRIILFEQDINTLTEELPTKRYTESDISIFFGSTIPEFNNILSQYYPIERG